MGDNHYKDHIMRRDTIELVALRTELINKGAREDELLREIEHYQVELENEKAMFQSLADQVALVLRPRLAEAERLLRTVTWSSKIHLSDCDCADCEAVEKFLSVEIK